jgi:hypothetical protein
MSPKIYEEKGIEFYINLNDHGPAHVHAVAGRRSCKIQISPVQLIRNMGMKAGDVRKALKLASEMQELFLTEWNKYFPPE